MYVALFEEVHDCKFCKFVNKDILQEVKKIELTT